MAAFRTADSGEALLKFAADSFSGGKIILSADFIMQRGNCRAVEFNNPAAMLTNHMPGFFRVAENFISGRWWFGPQFGWTTRSDKKCE